MQEVTLAGSAVGLAGRLREATRMHHRRAERAGIMPALLRGSLPRATYGALLRNLHALYAALEAALDEQQADRRIAPIWNPALRRSDALRSDLATLDAADGPLAPETHAYVAHLQGVAARAPHRLVAHAYVRYLGDLSGGQILARVAGEAYGLTAREGLRFYTFGDGQAQRRLATRLREGLDANPLSHAEADELVGEACAAFDRHERLFDELARP